MFFALLAATNGLLTVISRMVNASLGRAVGSLQGSFVNHVVGTLGAATVLLVAGWSTGLLALAEVPWIYFTGGCIGVLVVAASNHAVAHIGATLFAVLLLTGQIVASAAVDHFSLLGNVQIRMNPLKLIGLVLLLAGALLVITDRFRTIQDTVPD